MLHQTRGAQSNCLWPMADAQQLLSNDPQVPWWAWCHRTWNIWNIPLACWAQLSWLCPLLTSSAPPAYCWRNEELKTPCLSVSTAHQQLKKSVCYQHYSHPKCTKELYPSWNQAMCYSELIMTIRVLLALWSQDIFMWVHDRILQGTFLWNLKDLCQWISHYKNYSALF